MPKSKTTKSKPSKKNTTAKAAGSPDAAKPPLSKRYKFSKSGGLTNNQKAALARQLMICAGELMEVQDEKFNDDALLGINRKLMGAQLAAWVSYLPGAFWDSRLPQPIRARGRRKF